MDTSQESIVRIADSIRCSSINEEIFWKNVFSVLNDLIKNNSLQDDPLWVAKFLLCCLQIYGCSDVLVTAGILKAHTLFSERCLLELSEHLDFCMHMLNKLMKRHLVSGYTNSIVHFEDSLSNIDSLNASVETWDFQFLTCLVEYTVPSKKKINFGGLQNIVASFLLVWCYIKENVLREEVTRVSCFLMAKDLLMYISERDRRFPDERPKRRIRFVLQIMKALIMRKENGPSTEKYVQCIRQSFRVIPEPYVARDEVEIFLLFLFKNVSAKEQHIKMFVTLYEELFDFENSMSYAPRSLKHLSRCVIRGSIVKRSNHLPQSVNQLPLPNPLKKYLLCKTE